MPYCAGKTVVRHEIAKGRRKGIPYRLISAELGRIDAGNTELPYADIRIERLSASLVPEAISLKVDSVEEALEFFAGMKDSQGARRLRQTVLEAAGADGEIDTVALRAMQLRGCDIPDVLTRLPYAEGGILDVKFQDGSDRGVVLFWRDGIVHANFRLEEQVHWRNGTVSFDEMPARFPANPSGQLLSTYFRNDAIPEGTIITGGYRSERQATADVNVPPTRFNSRQRKILAA